MKRIVGNEDTSSPERQKKIGVLKRFLNWLIKGTEKSIKEKASCST